jgi:hypothetical protein
LVQNLGCGKPARRVGLGKAKRKTSRQDVKERNGRGQQRGPSNADVLALYDECGQNGLAAALFELGECLDAGLVAEWWNLFCGRQGRQLLTDIAVIRRNH